jgi:Ecdysteroid kinase-like family
MLSMLSGECPPTFLRTGGQNPFSRNMRHQSAVKGGDMIALPIPKTIDAITPEWLTGAINASGENSVSVTSFKAEEIAAGVGFNSKLARLTIHYEGVHVDAPLSLVVKLPTLAPGGRGLATMFRFYEREVRFYEEIAGRVPIRVPRAYHSAYDPASGDFVLLLEDLAPARLGDPLVGCSLDETQSAVRAIAELHATWWQKPELGAFAWMPNVNDPVHHSAEPAYQQCWPGYLAFAGNRLSLELRRIGEHLSTRVIRMLDVLHSRPCTFVHGDYRADNLFFTRGGTAPKSPRLIGRLPTADAARSISPIL